jgi:4-amino-4-deoxy-L-arabinose transferase-like glycosyltransferase
MAATRPLVAPPGAASGAEAPASGTRSLAPGLDLAWAVVLAATLAGVIVRVLVAGQSIFADELSTYWISATHSLGDVLSLLYSTGRIHHAEITPPLSFLASWLTTRAGTSPILLRLPALIAGTATIPLVYVLGRRCVGRRAAVFAAVLTALSPFMIYYSAEARAYGLLMFFVLGSTLSMLLAVDTGRRRYWVLYAVCSAAAFYTHYTCVFVLLAQAVWLLWTEPRLRRSALLANLGAVVLVLPWVPGLIADENSPTLKILSALSAFSAHAVRVDIEHWAVGYPYAQSLTLPSVATGLRQLPGLPALVMLALAAVLTAGGVAVRWWRSRPGARLPRRVGLVLLLALITPVGECIFSALGSHIIGVRDLAASWPFLALTGAAAITAAGMVIAATAAGLVLVAFGIGAGRMLEARFARPDYRAAAAYVAAHAPPGAVVLDETGGLSPGPLTGFDVAYHGRLRVLRAKSPAERDHPFTLFDPILPVAVGQARAVAAAAPARIFVVGAELPRTAFSGGYRLVALRRYTGLEQTLVGVYAPTAP